MQTPLHPGLNDLEHHVGGLLAHVAALARKVGNQEDAAEAETLVADHRASAHALQHVWHTPWGTKIFVAHREELLGRAEIIGTRLQRRSATER